MTARTILVTGGAGYIGSHACKALAAVGYVPVTFDNLSTGHAVAVKWGPLHVGDVCDTPALQQAIAASGAIAVMHFAASAYVGESVENPQKYYRNNVGGMTSLLDAIAATGVAALVFSSSCATYGEPGTAMIGESTTQRPINPYGRTKLIGEEMIRDFRRARALQGEPFNYAILRYFNAAGADPDGELVEDHDPETHLIPRILLAALGESDVVRIFGDDYPTPDGTCVRDFIHVTDLVEGHILALDRILAGEGPFTLNLGTGRGSSILDVLQVAEDCIGRKIPTQIEARRPGDPASLVADPALARKEIGFSPTRSDLPTVVATALNALRRLHPTSEQQGID